MKDVGSSGRTAKLQEMRSLKGIRDFWKGRPLWTVFCLALVQCQATPVPPNPEQVAASQPEAIRPVPPVADHASVWRPLEADNIHDPSDELLSYLQEPEEALSALPRAKEPGGNNVDWVAALEDGVISPRSKIQPSTEVRLLDNDIIMPNTAGMARVVFPHRQHTEWLDCSNCHPKIFKAKAGANKFGMFDILQGEYCGRCHGAVSFPLTQCFRCHSLPYDDK